MGRVILKALLVVLVAPSSWALDLYFLRHAETVANATKIYSAGNWTNFSKKGQQQIATITEKLKDHHFNAVLVSPLFRTQKTIFPFLENRGQVAEIWPELQECCWQQRWPRKVEHVALGGDVETLNTNYFRLRDDLRQVYRPQNFAEGVYVLKRAAELLKTRFGQSDESVLLVMHQYSGSCLMELLLGETPKRRYKLENAKLSKLEQNADGTFKLVVLNDQPYP